MYRLDKCYTEEVKDWVQKKWNQTASKMAVEALGVLLEHRPELAQELVKPILDKSEYWLEKIACEILGLEFKNDCDFQAIAVGFEVAERSRCLFEAMDYLWEVHQKGERPETVEIEVENGCGEVEFRTFDLLKRCMMVGDSVQIPEPFDNVQTYSELARKIAEDFPVASLCEGMNEGDRELVKSRSHKGLVPVG